VIIRHLSDLHGAFPKPTQEFDITILSGDIFPDFLGYGRTVSARRQESWIKINLGALQDWSEDKPVFYILGNHDFIDSGFPAEELGWVNLNDTYGSYIYESSPMSSNIIGMYGFPWIPWCGGNWNYELDDSAMLTKVQEMRIKFQEHGYPDILVAHSPPYGILDTAYTRLGNRRLADALSYSFPVFPKLVLFGHIHECGGETICVDGTVFSNAACTQNYLEI
jgi:Icc-related predicted phosphoesterase